MTPLAVFYHCRLSGGDPPIDFDHAAGIMQEQMSVLQDSGLNEAASHVYVGVNGGPCDYMAALCLVPEKAVTVQHPGKSRGEMPTLHALQGWVRDHPGWYVLYHHIKGAMYKGDPFRMAWRQRMQNALVSNWRQCIQDLDHGFDAVGCHWLVPERYPGLVGSPYFGGNFWWAKSSYLATLPPLPEPTWENRYHGEAWVGTAVQRPNVKDYHPGWP